MTKGWITISFNEEMDKYLFLCKNSCVFSDFERDDKKPDTDRILHYIIDNRLTESQKYCIKRYYFDNLSSAQIAEMTGTSRANVNMHLKRARAKIKREFTSALKRIKSQSQDI